MDQRPATSTETERLTWHCERCQVLIAHGLSPQALRVGHLVIRNRAVKGYCAMCGHRFRWGPAETSENST